MDFYAGANMTSWHHQVCAGLNQPEPCKPPVHFAPGASGKALNFSFPLLSAGSRILGINMSLSFLRLRALAICGGYVHVCVCTRARVYVCIRYREYI